MARLLVGLVALAVAFYVYALVDCILFPRMRVRALPKIAWVFIVLLFPIVGGVLWFLLGRGRRASKRQVQYRSIGPDDDPDFLGALKADPVSEAQLRELEEQFAEKDDPDKRTDSTDNGRTER